LPTLPGDTLHNGVVKLIVPIDFSLHNARFCFWGGKAYFVCSGEWRFQQLVLIFPPA
jgi:hypothetical protein